MKIFQIKPRSKGKHQIYQINPHDLRQTHHQSSKNFHKHSSDIKIQVVTNLGSTGKKFNLGKKTRKMVPLQFCRTLQSTATTEEDSVEVCSLSCSTVRERERERERRWRPLDSQFRNWEGSVGTVVFTFQ